MPRVLPVILTLVLLSACSSARPRGAESVDAAARATDTARLAADAEERHRALPRLIAMLESSDPAERLIAINTLEQLTGETRGYRHYDPEWRRSQAVDRWVRWWRGQGQHASSETGAAETPNSTPGHETHDNPVTHASAASDEESRAPRGAGEASHHAPTP